MISLISRRRIESQVTELNRLRQDQAAPGPDACVPSLLWAGLDGKQRDDIP